MIADQPRTHPKAHSGHLTVCYFGTYRAEYSRNQILIEGLRRAGVHVIECHVQLWTGVEDRIRMASGGWVSPRFWVRVLKAYLALLRKYKAIKDYDVMVVGYPGQVDVYLARLLTWLRRKPLAWDVFMSIYLIALERGLHRYSGLTVRAIRHIEQLACRLPDRLILDTDEYVEWFHRTHGVNPKRFHLVPTGADDRIYRPIERPQSGPRPFTLVYYGTFIPNHGVTTIIQAAHLLAHDRDVRFVLIGRGPEKDKAVALVQQHHLTNVTFIDWVAREDLPQYVAQADVCLGAFGSTPQSLMTIQNKIYEALAMAKPVITGDSPAIRKLLEHGEHVYLCVRDDAEALAESINVLRLDSDLRRTLASMGYAHYLNHFTTERLGSRFRRQLTELAGGTMGE